MLNILICGVGGQGTLFTSRVLGEYAAIVGLDCKLSEVHGMAQRGGSVVTHVKIGDKVNSPIVEAGSADVLMAFEELEGLRMVHYVKPGGKMLLNTQQINPLPVILGAAKYPEKVVETLKERNLSLYTLDALELSKISGNTKTGNTVIFGALTKVLGFEYSIMEQALIKRVPEISKESNIIALKLGFDSIK